MIPYILYSEILHIFETPPSGTWKLSDGVVDWLYENSKLTEGYESLLKELKGIYNEYDFIILKKLPSRSSLRLAT